MAAERKKKLPGGAHKLSTPHIVQIRFTTEMFNKLKELSIQFSMPISGLCKLLVTTSIDETLSQKIRK